MSQLYHIYFVVTQWMADTQDASWRWIQHLDRTQWLLMLGVTTAVGFFCMRGYGSRNKY